MLPQQVVAGRTRHDARGAVPTAARNLARKPSTIRRGAKVKRPWIQRISQSSGSDSSVELRSPSPCPGESEAQSSFQLAEEHRPTGAAVAAALCPLRRPVSETLKGEGFQRLLGSLGPPVLQT